MSSPAQPSSMNAARLRGGLLAPEKGHMPTLFTMTIVWLLLTIWAFVLGPYLAKRYDDSDWSDAASILRWSCLAGVSTIHGILVYLITHRRGFSAWWFVVGAAPGLLLSYGLYLAGQNPLWGAAGFPLTLMLAAIVSSSRPLTDPQPPGGLLKILDRVAFMCGNIWWGLLQLAILTATLTRATIYESQVGGSTGNEAAYVSFYNAWWFGLLCILFFITLYCATMRKFPFRIPQIGWLCVHAGLLGLLVGCMVMYWGSYEGRVQLYEGESKSVARSVRERELEVSVPSLGLKETFLISADRDPEKENVHQTFELEKDGRRFTVKIDQYYSQAEVYRELEDHPVHEGHHHDHDHEAGVQLDITPGRRNTHILLENTNPSAEFGNLFAVFLHRIPNERTLKGFRHRYSPTDTARGKLVVRSTDGTVLAELPITPGQRDADPSLGAVISGVESSMPERQLVIKPVRYYDYFASDSNRGVFDAAPGSPQMPGLIIEVASARGLHRFAALANGQYGVIERAQTDPPRDIVLDYDCIPELPIRPSSMTIAVGPGENQKQIIVVDKDGHVRTEPFELKRTYRLAENAPISVTPTRYFDSATIRQGFRRSKSDGFRAIHVTANSDGQFAQSWIVADAVTSGNTVQLGNTRVDLHYKSRTRDLGFSLACIDFREFRYANSTKPKAYETNVILRDPANDIEEAVLVDMNHPLDYNGFRVFNSSPIHDTENNRRGVVFQIARNPGYGMIIFNCLVVTIGLIIVFFFKPALRRVESRRKAARAPAAGGHSALVMETTPQGV